MRQERDRSVVGDRIVEASPGPTAAAGAVDCDGDYLLPGLVELHTDNLEQHFMPRPGVRWPSRAAVVGHDAEIIAAGITTVFDSIAVGETAAGGDRLAYLGDMIDTVEAAQKLGLLRAEHRLHLRCEVSHGETLDLFKSFLDRDFLGLVSIMDHTPGQRQFIDVEKYRHYYRGKYGFTDEEFERFVARQAEAHTRYAASHRAAIVALARERGLTLASHDDATPEHVAAARADGMAIAEFPTTIAAAQASRAAGMLVLMGAPNLVRGGSHSGNVSTLDLARRGILDILSSDYVPGSLIHGAFLLAQGDHGIDLCDAVALVSRNPARAVGLDDRGALAPELRADIVRIRVIEGLPLIRTVWRGGDRAM
jgi:alpha-D-ribose 1-methylphosphonate 5-triphosphate diphosphatase